MPEWSIGAVSKTVVPSGTQGSNPCPSAINLGFQGVTNNVHGCTYKSNAPDTTFGAFVLYLIPACQGIFLFLFRSFLIRLLIGL